MEDFYSASIRHFADAEHLQSDNRLDNAGHLYGVSGECAIKAVCIEESGRRPAKHFDTEASRDLRHHAGANLIGRKGQRLIHNLPGLFAGWSVHHRYEATGFTSAAQVALWRTDAQSIIDILQGL